MAENEYTQGRSFAIPGEHGPTFIEMGSPSFLLVCGNHKWPTEWHPYFGPNVVNKDGSVKHKQPSERSMFWKVAVWWKNQGARVVDGVGQWKEPPREKIRYRQVGSMKIIAHDAVPMFLSLIEGEVMQAILGIDPGLGGGIAVQFRDTVIAYKMPETQRDLFDLLAQYPEGLAFVEKVNAGPKMGASAAFKFGQSVGAIAMACLAAGLKMELVSPQRWQKEMGLIVSGRGLGQNDTAKKNRNKARAQELFPRTKCTHAISDALLISEYGRRVEASRRNRQVDVPGVH